MKKVLISLIIMSLLGFNTVAFAAEEGSTVNAGVTPDSILYSADQLFEDLQLAFTTNSEKEAELLLKFAQERLAEAKEMTEEAKTEFVKTAMDAYIETLGQAEEKVAEVAAEESTTEEVANDLSQQLEDTAKVDVAIEENLEAEQQQQLEEKTIEVSYTANVVKDLDAEVVKTLREEGMGFGNIAHTIALSQLSGKSIEEIANMIGEGKGFGNIAKELGIHPSKMNKEPQIAAEEEEEVVTEENTTAESSENTAAEAETQTTNIQTVVNTITSNQDDSKQVQSSNVKAAINKEDSKTTVDTKNQKISENDGTTNIIQKDNTVKDNSTIDNQNNQEKIDNKNEEKNIKSNNGNGNSGKNK